MNIGGIPVTKCEEVLVLPRVGENLVFKARAIEDMIAFDVMCPKPVAPTRLTSQGEVSHESDNFLSSFKAWSAKRFAYICVKSLEESEIEWGEVDLEKPETWTKWTDELVEAGLASVEVQKVQTLVLEANALSESKLKEARDAFLHGQASKE